MLVSSCSGNSELLVWDPLPQAHRTTHPAGAVRCAKRFGAGADRVVLPPSWTASNGRPSVVATLRVPGPDSDQVDGLRCVGMTVYEARARSRGRPGATPPGVPEQHTPWVWVRGIVTAVTPVPGCRVVVAVDDADRCETVRVRDVVVLSDGAVAIADPEAAAARGCVRVGAQVAACIPAPWFRDAAEFLEDVHVAMGLAAVKPAGLLRAAARPPPPSLPSFGGSSGEACADVVCAYYTPARSGSCGDRPAFITAWCVGRAVLGIPANAFDSPLHPQAVRGTRRAFVEHTARVFGAHAAWVRTARAAAAGAAAADTTPLSFDQASGACFKQQALQHGPLGVPFYRRHLAGWVARCW